VAADNAKLQPSATATAFEPASPWLLAVARGAQRAEGAVNLAAAATAVVMTGGAVGIGIGAAGGTGLVSLGVASGPLIGLLPQEQQIAQELIAQGHTVVAIARGPGKTADFVVDGIVTELKTLTSAGPNTVKNAIENAAKQSNENILIDARKVGISAQDAAHQIQRAAGNIGNIAGRVTVLTKEGPVKH